MSGAQDKNPVYPNEQGSIKQFEMTYDQYRLRIRKYLSLKVNAMVADDLTQQVFLKAIENIHTFKENSNLFTWILKLLRIRLKMSIEVYREKKKFPMILLVITGH